MTAGSGPARVSAAGPRSASSCRSARTWAATLTDGPHGALAPERTLSISLDLASDDDLRALRGALLAARASELSEVQRRAQRHGLGYGTDSQRDSMTDDVADRRRRWEMLDRLIAAIDAATMNTSDPGSARDG